MQKVAKLAGLIDDDAVFKLCLGSLVFMLFAWSAFASILNWESWDAVVSAGRLVGETILVLLLLRSYHRRPVGLLITSIAVLGAVNGIVVILQLMEGVGYISSNFSSISTDFWQRPVIETARKSGLFNGFLTSSLVGFVTLAVVSGRRGVLNRIIELLASTSIIFGARTFFVFLPIYLMFNRGLLVAVALTSGMLWTYALPAEFKDIVSVHVEERLLPAALVIVNLNPELDYSASDTRYQYRAPANVSELLIGNGYPHYAKQGGQDPALSRWLLQAGIPAVLLVTLISGLIIWRIFRIGTAGNILLALSLCLATLKGELVTATLIYSVLFGYALAAPVYFKQTALACSSRRSPA